MTLADGIYYLNKDIAKMSVKNLYGLHNKPNICNILNRQMIVRALEYNNIHSVLSQSDIDMFTNALISPTNCSTCNK